MVPPAYRLDTLAALLIARLEPSRRALEGDEAATRATFERLVRDAARAVAEECRETLGDTAQADRLEREAVATFLPRYTRLALAQNAAEARGFGFLFGEGPFARIGATVLALAAAAVLSRVVHHWTSVLFFVAAAFVPFLPEVRTAWSRRGYRARLQELADDMGRIQEAEQELPALTVDKEVP